MAKLQVDIAFYEEKHGHILILGDLNAHVAAQPEPVDDDTQRGPLFGMEHGNQSGQQLLTLCADNDLFFLSGRAEESSGPTCVRTSASTIVDHIVGSQGTLAWNRTVGNGGGRIALPLRPRARATDGAD